VRNFFFGVVVACLVPVILVAALFLSLPKLSHWHDAYSSIPAFVVRYPIVNSRVAGDFSVMSGYLQRQARIATWLGMTDRMSQDLVNNTYRVMETMRYRRQYSDMLPWLQQLSSLADNRYFAKLFQGNGIEGVIEAGGRNGETLDR
jgi:hypothetical protein